MMATGVLTSLPPFYNPTTFTLPAFHSLYKIGFAARQSAPSSRSRSEISTRTPSFAMSSSSSAFRGTDAHRYPQVLIHVHEPTSYSKRRSIVNDGIDSLHVVLDFDHTLTSYLDSKTGERCLECHDILQHGPYLPATRQDAFRADIDAIWSDQHEGKMSHDISEWWWRFHEAIVKHGLTRDDIQTAVETSNTVLRPSSFLLLEWLKRNNVQTTIVSAGISTIIEDVLEKEGVELHERVRVVANVPRFDAKGTVIGFEEPLIHSKNKPEVLREMDFNDDHHGRIATAASGEEDVLQAAAKRSNIVLAGNSIGDAKCLEGLVWKQSLSFGFLHEEVRDGRNVSEMCASALADPCLSMTDLAKAGVLDHPLYSEGGKEKLEEFARHYDVISCGYQSDFCFLMDLFHEMEENHKKF